MDQTNQRASDLRTRIADLAAACLSPMRGAGNGRIAKGFGLALSFPRHEHLDPVAQHGDLPFLTGDDIRQILDSTEEMGDALFERGQVHVRMRLRTDGPCPAPAVAPGGGSR
jgi:hypothetical protein